MKLSVIVPCLNGTVTIATQLEALANQQWSEPWEVIISDNGSTDDSLAIVEQYRERLPNLRVVDSSDRRGAGHARNVGILAAAGEALAFCDVDDEVAPGWVAAVGQALFEHNFIVCQIEDKKLNPPWVQGMWNPSQNGPVTCFNFLPTAASWGIGFKRSLYETIGGFDESFLRLQDIDYSWRVQLAGMKLHFVPNAVVHYRYRHTFAGMYYQAYLSGQYNILLYKKYAPLGMLWPSSWKTGPRAWLRLLNRLPRRPGKENWGKWIVKFGFQVGLLYGSIKYGIFTS